MKADALVLKRLSELIAKGESLAATKKQGDRPDYFKVEHPDVNGWATSVRNLLQRVFGEDSSHMGEFAKLYDGFHAYQNVKTFARLQAVLAAAKEDYEGGYLFKLRGLVKAEVLSDAMEQAEALLAAGYKDPACVVTGISLELAVKELASRASIPHGKLDKMNADLGKADVYNMAKQKQITAWAELRNKAAHGQWDQYTAADVAEMLSGVKRFLGDFL